MIIVILLVVCFVIGVAAYSIKQRREAKGILQEALNAMQDFNATKVIENDAAVYYFAVDEKRQEVFCFSDCKGVRFRFKDIVSAEILIDGDVTETHKSVSLGGAVAGGLLAGGLGAVVGGSSMGKATSVKKVRSLTLHILLRNARVDCFDYNFLSGETEHETSSMLYKVIYKDARSMFYALKLAMDRVKQSEQTKPKHSAQNSDIEELKALADLKNQGLITEEEFATMKAKIINK